MITYLEEKIGFPREASECFEKALLQIARQSGGVAELLRAVPIYFSGDNEATEKILGAIAEKSGVHIYTVNMVFLLTCTEPLRLLYREKGLSEEVFAATMSDMTCKIKECYAVYGIWGTFVFRWYRGFFLRERFALGRLQFERAQLWYRDYGVFKYHCPVVTCHIPSSGKLLYNDVMESLRLAYEAFADVRVNGLLPVTCHSWMLYKKHIPLYPEGSNIERFVSLFHIVKDEALEKNEDFWRIFNCEYSEENLINASEKSSLQRNFKKFLLDGNTMGNGYGILLFDGENIVGERF